MVDDITPAKPKKKRRGLWWKVPLYGLALLLLAFAMFRFVVHQRVQNRLNAIRDAGYPVTLEELDAWYAYPDGPNAADVYQQAFEAYVAEEQLERILAPLNGHTQLPGPGEKMPEEVAKRVANYLERNAKAIALLEEAAKIDECRFPIDLREGYVLLPHGVQLKQAVRMLKLQSLLDADRGHYDRAADRCLTMIAVAQAMKNEPILLSQTISISHQYRVYEHIEQLLATGRISDSRLQSLSQAINQIDLDRMALRAMVWEQCLGHDLFNNPATLINEYPYNTMRSRIGFIARRVTGWLDIDHYHYLDITQSRIHFAEHPTWPVPKSLDDNRLFAPPHQTNSFWRKPLGPTLITYQSFFISKADKRVVLTGIAVERYRQKHSQLPAQPQDLVPEFLDTIPNDPFTGIPLSYRLEGAGAIIYSLGVDGVDDGGRERDEYGMNAFSNFGTTQDNHTDITFTFGGLQEKLWPSEVEDNGGQ